MAADRPLTRKQQRFVEELLTDPRMEGAAAARRAGYAERSAKKAAHEMMRDPRILAAIQHEIAARSKRTHITADRVLEELAAVALSNIEHYAIDDDGEVDLTESAPTTAMRAVSSMKKRITKRAGGIIDIETEIKFWDKNTALTNAMKHLGLLKDQVEVSGPNGGPIATTLTVRFVTSAKSEASE